LVLSGLGFYDDYAKIIQQSGGGTPPRVKLLVQTGLGLFVGIYLLKLPATSELLGNKNVIHSNLVSDLMLPFCKFPIAAGAIVGVLVVLLAIVGSSNAVNLTDGLDGLAIGCTLITAFVFLVFTYVAGNVKIASYLQIPYVSGAGELTVFCAAMIGAGLGFLWYNCHPAQVFMGDTGSLALGGAFGIIAVLIHQPFVLVIAGGVFVLEALSVLLQTGWFRFTRMRTGTGRRIFLMAPLHHHFEKKGWYESQVVMRFYILCVLCAVVALATLKLR
jgi:phospho-N-acetylmuramoyl-pentapeptide-transferase